MSPHADQHLAILTAGVRQVTGYGGILDSYSSLKQKRTRRPVYPAEEEEDEDEEVDDQVPPGCRGPALLVIKQLQSRLCPVPRV